jgi:hypothetical protein
MTSYQFDCPVGASIQWTTRAKGKAYSRSGVVLAHLAPGASALAELAKVRPGAKLADGGQDVSRFARYLVERKEDVTNAAGQAVLRYMTPIWSTVSPAEQPVPTAKVVPPPKPTKRKRSGARSAVAAAPPPKPTKPAALAPASAPASAPSSPPPANDKPLAPASTKAASDRYAAVLRQDRVDVLEVFARGTSIVVRFRGDQPELWRVFSVATKESLPVTGLHFVWPVQHGVPGAPWGEIVLAPS